jgi:polynucleotide 5'-hydroxyl-kinase GRC3/NOL9
LPEWESAAQRFLEVGGTVMVLGGADTGKSTFCRYLIYRAYLAGEPVALVDLDLGQSHLGPPTCLGLGLFPPRFPGDDGLFPEGLYFIGDTSPVGAILEVAVGCRALVDLANRQGVKRVVVNTSGFIQGPGAGLLKRAEVELLNPSLLFALERHQELKFLLRYLGALPVEEPPILAGQFPPPRVGGERGEGEPSGFSNESHNSLNSVPTIFSQGQGDHEPSGRPLVRLPVSSRVLIRSPEDRRRYRKERWRGYFEKAGRLTLPWGSMIWEGLPLRPQEPLEAGDRPRLGEDLGVPEPPAPLAVDHLSPFFLDWLNLRLAGLLDGLRRTLALGLILPEPEGAESLALWTPLPREAVPRVRFLKVGKIRVTPEGRELSHV